MRFIVRMMILLLFVSNAYASQAVIEIGTAVEKYEVTGKSSSFTVAPDTKLYAGMKVSGIENGEIKVVFSRDGKESSKVLLKIPRSPYRTHAFWTLKPGYSGLWNVKVIDTAGNVLASSDVTVKVTDH